MLDSRASLPEELHHPRFAAVPLTAARAALDYACYMASADVIRVHSGGRWPVEGFTLADNVRLVERHQADHVARRSFTFTLLAPSCTEALGCLYLNSLRACLQRAHADPQQLDALPSTAAMVTFWLRQDQQDTGLAAAVAEAVNDWLRGDWPFAMHVFRILPDERASRMALERLALTRIDLAPARQEQPYLWYQPA